MEQTFPSKNLFLGVQSGGPTSSMVLDFDMKLELISSFKGGIVWFFGPFLCGILSDFKVFKLNLKTLLLPTQEAMGDNGYNGDCKICSLKDSKI